MSMRQLIRDPTQVGTYAVEMSSEEVIYHDSE